MAKPDFEQNLGRDLKNSGQQLNWLGKSAKFIEQQAAILLIFHHHAKEMPTEVAGNLMHGVAEGREVEVLQTLTRVGQKFLK